MEVRPQEEAELLIKLVETVLFITGNGDIKISSIEHVMGKPIKELFSELTLALDRVQYRIAGKEVERAFNRLRPASNPPQ